MKILQILTYTLFTVGVMLFVTLAYKNVSLMEECQKIKTKEQKCKLVAIPVDKSND